jgi:hypothetical protein
LEYAADGVVIDVGGISLYHLLGPLFYPAQLYILNIDPEETKGAPSIVASAFQLAFKNETCDIIIWFDVLELVLRPGGLFVLAITNLWDIYTRIAFLFAHTPFRYDPSTCKVGSLSRFRVTQRGHEAYSHIEQ